MADKMTSKVDLNIERLEKAKKTIKALENDLHDARSSWAIFKAGNGDTKTERNLLHNSLGETRAAHTFNSLMRISANYTVLSLSRISDPPRSDRNSLMTLKGLIGPIQDSIIENAGNWYSDLSDEGEIPFCEENKKLVEAQLPSLIKRISNFCSSDSIKRIRSLRDNAIAHSLSEESFTKPIVSDVESSFEDFGSILRTASLVVCGSDFDPESDFKVYRNCAEEFFDILTCGLLEFKKAHSLDRAMRRP